MNFESSFIYRDQFGKCTKISGTFFKNEKISDKSNYLIYNKNKNEFVYESNPGDKCVNDSFRAIYIFKNYDEIEYPNVKTNYDITVPNNMHEEECNRTIEVKINFEKSIETLLIQRFFNNYWIFTGIVLIIIGLYLMILAQNQKATKFLISIIFGEILIFSITVGIFGLKLKYMDWILFVMGILIGGFIGYFSLDKNKLYRKFLSLTAGYILGIVIFDLLFLHRNYQVLATLFTDSILIFSLSIFTFIYLFPEYHYFCDSIIGAYLFIRGISVLLQKSGKYGRYRELQLTLYLINHYEFEYANYYYNEEWPIYYIYDIFITLFMIVSMLYYYYKAVGLDEDEEEEKEDDIPEAKLLDVQKTTATEDVMDLE